MSGPKLESGTFHIVAGRMGAGQGTVRLELFVDTPVAAAAADFPVNPQAEPSRMALGQERDAIQHPGHESFDGEIARFLIWERPLDEVEIKAAIELLRKTYFKDR